MDIPACSIVYDYIENIFEKNQNAVAYAVAFRPNRFYLVLKLNF